MKMIGALILAAASFLTSPVDEIVLLNGAVIEVKELVRVERGRLIYEDDEGVLYSIRLTDVDVDETDARLPANRQSQEVVEEPERPVEARSALPRDLPVSEEEKKRILAEMERRSHTGQNPSQVDTPSSPADLELSVESETGEWEWRNAARRFDEAVREAKERLEAARQREKELNDLLLFFSGRSGDATNYSYLVYQLSDLRSMIPRLESQLSGAERARQQFRNDARRQGIPPGWLR